MTPEEVQVGIRRAVDSLEIPALKEKPLNNLTSALLLLVDSACKEKLAVMDSAIKQFAVLNGSMANLTIPLSDNTIARVGFSGELTPEKMKAFVAIFTTISENYFPSGGEGRNSRPPKD